MRFRCSRSCGTQTWCSSSARAWTGSPTSSSPSLSRGAFRCLQACPVLAHGVWGLGFSVRMLWWCWLTVRVDGAAYARATPCPVLASHMLVPAERHRTSVAYDVILTDLAEGSAL
eukprot:1273687-Rhodomonas_salina.2